MLKVNGRPLRPGDLERSLMEAAVEQVRLQLRERAWGDPTTRTTAGHRHAQTVYPSAAQQGTIAWNPVVGATKISAGCKHCYAESMAKRLKAMGTPGYERGFALTLLPERLQEPLRRKRPTVYFVNSMSDLFHERVPERYIDRVFDVIRRTP